MAVSGLGSFTDGFGVKDNIGINEFIDFGTGTLSNLADGYSAKYVQNNHGNIEGTFDMNHFDFGTNAVFGMMGTVLSNYLKSGSTIQNNEIKK